MVCLHVVMVTTPFYSQTGENFHKCGKGLSYPLCIFLTQLLILHHNKLTQRLLPLSRLPQLLFCGMLLCICQNDWNVSVMSRRSLTLGKVCPCSGSLDPLGMKT